MSDKFKVYMLYPFSAGQKLTISEFADLRWKVENRFKALRPFPHDMVEDHGVIDGVVWKIIRPRTPEFEDVAQLLIECWVHVSPRGLPSGGFAPVLDDTEIFECINLNEEVL